MRNNIHINNMSIANEGIFFHNKNPKIGRADGPLDSGFEYLTYKSMKYPVPRVDWAKYAIEKITHCPEEFLTEGISDIKKFIVELNTAKQFVDANYDNWVNAVKNRDKYTLNNLADDLRNCFPELIMNNAKTNKSIERNGNGDIYGGKMVTIPENKKKEIYQLLTILGKIFRDAVIDDVKTFLVSIYTRSKISYLTTSKETLKERYNSNNYLKNEFILFCKDVIYGMEYAFNTNLII